MDGCVIVPLLLILVGLFFAAERRWEEKGVTPPERHVDGRSIDPAETYRTVMAAVDEVQGRWLGGRYGDEVIHLHLPSRAEIARHDSDLRRSLRWLEKEAGAVDVVLHYEGEPPIDRRVRWDRVERSTDGSVRKAEWRRKVPRMGHKEAGCLPILGIIVVLVIMVGVALW